MDKLSRTQQAFAEPSSENGARIPRLEEIKRALFPRLVAAEPRRSATPRFADLIDRFAARR
jgi:hypothetical protein